MLININKIFAIALISFSTTSIVQAEDLNTSIYEFHTYGLSPPPKQNDNAENIVNNKWHIRYKVVAGCIIDNEIVAKTKRNNDSVETALSKVYGTDWEQKLEKEIKQEDVLNQKVYKLCDNNKDVQALHLNEQDKYYILTTNNSKQYTVQVTLFPQRADLLTLLVDLDKNTVIKMSPTK